MKKLIFLTLFLGTTILSFGQTYSENFNFIIDEIERGAFDEAIKRCDELIKTHPDSPLVYVLKGEAYTKQIRRLTKDDVVYDKAMAAYQKAFALDSTNLLAINSTMLLNMYHQKYDLAIYYAKRLIQLHEEEWQFAQGILNLANAYGFIGESEKAVKVYLMGIENIPSNGDFYNNLAMTYGDMKEYDKAQECLHKAIKISPEDMGYKGNLAFIFTEISKHEEAIQIYDEILAKEVNPLAYNNRGYAKLKLGNPEEALKDINASLRIYPDNSYAFRNRALVHIAMKNTTEACKDLKTANEMGFSTSYGPEVTNLIEKHCK